MGRAFTFVMSVCPSVRMERLGCHRTDCHDSWYLSIFRKSVENVRVSLKPCRNNGRCTCMYVSISGNFCWIEKYFWQNLWRNSKHNFMFNNIPPRRSYRLWGNVKRYGRAGQATDYNTWLMRIACWITKATDTPVEYVILIAFLQQ